MDSVALSLTSGRRKSMGAYRGRPGTGRSSRRNLPGCGGVDVVALAAAGMTGHRNSTSRPLLASLASQQNSNDSQGEGPQSIFDALIQLKVGIYHHHHRHRHHHHIFNKHCRQNKTQPRQVMNTNKCL